MTKTSRMIAGVGGAFVLGLAASHAAAEEAQAPAAPVPAPAAASAPAAGEAVSEAPPPLIATKDFAGRSSFYDARLSPGGGRLSYVLNKDGIPRIVISDVASKQIIRAFGTGAEDELEWYRWVTDDKLLLSVSTAGQFFEDEVRFTRMFLVEIGTGAMSPLFSRSAVVEGDNVIHVAKDGSYILVAMQKTIYDYPSVLRHELVPDGKVTTVQDPRDGVWNWVADDQGVVRMGTGWAGGRLKIFYRAEAEGELRLIARLKEDDAQERYWDALQIVGGSDVGYVLSEGENGRVGLRLFNFATRETVETVYEHPDWDIDSVTLKDGKPFAAFFTADRDEVHWFDAATDKQYKALKKALGDVEVWVASRSEDSARMLVWAGSEADPGVLYMFEPGAASLVEIAQYRPALDFNALARPRPMTYTARDGTPIRSYLTLPRGREAKGLPLIIMPHGGPYGIRDKLQYNDEVQLLANRGYAVLQPNYRGSGGYGEAFFELGTGQIGRAMQDDLDDAMDWAVKQGIADPKRVCVVGGSYGGYAAIWAVLRNPERYACAASWAGVTDFDRILRYDRGFFTRSGFKRWRDRVRGQGVSDMKAVSPVNFGAKLDRPLLLAHGTKDIVVPFSQYTAFDKATRAAPMPPQTLVIKDEGHSFSKAESEQAWYDALTAFLAQHNPPDPVPPGAAAAAPSAPAAAGAD